MTGGFEKSSVQPKGVPLWNDFHHL